MLLVGAVSAGLYGYQAPSAVLRFRWQAGLMAVSWLFSAACIGHFWMELKRGSLAWDGLNWQWAISALDETQVQASPQTGSVSVRFDGQRCLLIKFEPALDGAYSQWLWLDHTFAPEHWHDVRRAVYSRAKEPVFNTQH